MDSPPSGSLGGAGARPHGGWGSFRLRKAVEKNAGLGHSWVWAPELAEVQRPGWCGLESPWALLFGEAPDERWSLTHHQTDPLVLEAAVGEGVGAGSLPSRAPRPLGQAWGTSPWPSGAQDLVREMGKPSCPFMCTWHRSPASPVARVGLRQARPGRWPGGRSGRPTGPRLQDQAGHKGGSRGPGEAGSGTMGTQRHSPSWRGPPLLFLLLGLVVPLATAQAFSYREAVLRTVEGFNQQSSEPNLYRLLQLDPLPKDVSRGGEGGPTSSSGGVPAQEFPALDPLRQRGPHPPSGLQGLLGAPGTEWGAWLPMQFPASSLLCTPCPPPSPPKGSAQPFPTPQALVLSLGLLLCAQGGHTPFVPTCSSPTLPAPSPGPGLGGDGTRA